MIGRSASFFTAANVLLKVIADETGKLLTGQPPVPLPWQEVDWDWISGFHHHHPSQDVKKTHIFLKLNPLSIYLLPLK